MNEEEKRSIKITKAYLEDEKNLRDDYKWKSGFYANGDIERLLNLIDKQQKEIKELKEKERYWKSNAIPTSTINTLYISKDKIRKLKELVHKTLDEFEELLGE